MLLSLLLFLFGEVLSPHLRRSFHLYPYIALMSLRSRSRVKASAVLMRADHLCIHNYIRSLLNIISRHI